MSRKNMPGFTRPVKLLTSSLVTLNLVATVAAGGDVFPEPTFVTVKLDNAVEDFPSQTVWTGGPKMLYDAVTPDGRVLLATSPSSKRAYAFAPDSGKQRVAGYPLYLSQRTE